MTATTELWNGVAGRAWVEAQAVLDRMFEPFENLLVDEARGRALDVGCGTGATTLADRDKVQRILEAGGWPAVDIQPLDVACSIPEAESVPYLTKLGSLGLALHGVDQATRARIAGTVRAAFDPYVHGDEVRFNAAGWLIRAGCQSTP